MNQKLNILILNYLLHFKNDGRQIPFIHRHVSHLLSKEYDDFIPSILYLLDNNLILVKNHQYIITDGGVKYVNIYNLLLDFFKNLNLLNVPESLINDEYQTYIYNIIDIIFNNSEQLNNLHNLIMIYLVEVITNKFEISIDSTLDNLLKQQLKLLINKL